MSGKTSKNIIMPDYIVQTQYVQHDIYMHSHVITKADLADPPQYDHVSLCSWYDEKVKVIRPTCESQTDIWGRSAITPFPCRILKE